MISKKIMLVCSVAVIVGSLAVYSLNNEYHSNALIDQSKNIVQKIQGNQFGELKSKGLDKLSEKKEVVILEDDKYEYKVEPSSGEIVNFGIKNSKINKFLKTQNPSKITKDEAIVKSKVFLDKYFSDNTQKMEIADYSTKLDDANDVHMVSYEGTASNGVRTGEFVYMWINQDGELVSFARHKGNTEVAQNSKAKITSDMATKNAWDYIVKNFNIDNKISMSKDKITLEVYQDKLSYSVIFYDVGQAINKRDFYIKVDAQTGEIINVDYTK